MDDLSTYRAVAKFTPLVTLTSLPEGAHAMGFVDASISFIVRGGALFGLLRTPISSQSVWGPSYSDEMTRAIQKVSQFIMKSTEEKGGNVTYGFSIVTTSAHVGGVSVMGTSSIPSDTYINLYASGTAVYDPQLS